MKMQYHGPVTDELECGGVYDPADFPEVDQECWSTPSCVEAEARSIQPPQPAELRPEPLPAPGISE